MGPLIKNTNSRGFHKASLDCK